MEGGVSHGSAVLIPRGAIASIESLHVRGVAEALNVIRVPAVIGASLEGTSAVTSRKCGGRQSDQYDCYS